MNATPLADLQRTLYESRNPTRRYLHRRRREWVRTAIAALPSVATALEVGPGSGVYLEDLAARADRVLALDAEPEHLLAARTSLTDGDAAKRVGFVRADLRSPPLRSGGIDLLLCSEVFEHIPPEVPVLEHLASLLSPAGTLVFTTPQPWSPVEILGKIAFRQPLLGLLRRIYREPIEPTGHINVVSARALQPRLETAGLKIVAYSMLGAYLPLLGEFGGERAARWLRWLEDRMQHRGLRALLWTQCYVLQKAEGAASFAPASTLVSSGRHSNPRAD